MNGCSAQSDQLQSSAQVAPQVGVAAASQLKMKYK